MRLAVALLWLACAAARAETPSAHTHVLFDAYWEWPLRDNPRIASAVGDRRYDDRLQDRSEAAVAKRKEAMVRVLRFSSVADYENCIKRLDAVPKQLAEITAGLRRAKAQAALGDRFDVRRFNNALLDDGPLSLSVLERRIDEWIARERG